MAALNWNEHDAALIKGLTLVCSALRKEDPLMTVTNVQTLLEIALQEARASNVGDCLNVSQLSERVDTLQSNMSRILRLLGNDPDGARGRRAGLGFIDLYVSPTNYRERCAKLTSKGRALVRNLVRNME